MSFAEPDSLRPLLTFLRFNTPAVIIGISEFVVAGCFFGNHLDAIRRWLYEYAGTAVVAAGAITLSLIVRRHLGRRERLTRRA